MSKKGQPEKGHPGNQHAVKLKTPDVKKDAYTQYCKHIEEGWPKEAWCFDHAEIDLTWETMETYIEKSPSEFPPILMQKARAKRYMHWMVQGNNLMKGKYKNGSPVVWQTIMRNMFKGIGWDQKEYQTENGNCADVHEGYTKGTIKQPD